MARLVTRTESCRWSVPACRSNPMSDRDGAFETFWTCERKDTPAPITEALCESCRHWSPEGRPGRAFTRIQRSLP